MKNMYLAAAMVVSLVFSACSDEESGKADRAYKPIEIFGNINEVVNNVQETRAVGAAWGSDDRIGVTVETMQIMRRLMQWILISTSNIAMKPAVHSVL